MQTCTKGHVSPRCSPTPRLSACIYLLEREKCVQRKTQIIGVGRRGMLFQAIGAKFRLRGYSATGVGVCSVAEMGLSPGCRSCLHGPVLFPCWLPSWHMGVTPQSFPGVFWSPVWKLHVLRSPAAFGPRPYKTWSPVPTSGHPPRER